MIKMRALKDVPSVVGTITAGSQFWETNPDQADVWERTGVAERLKVSAVPGKITEPSPAWDHYHWQDLAVAILASGESLTAQQCELVKQWRNAGTGRRVIAINTTFRLAPFADVLYGCDRHWWNAYYEEASAIFKPGQMWTQLEGGAPLVNAIRSIRAPGLSKTLGVIHQGANGGYQAMGLAVMWGAKKLVLLGFDCKGGHWHGDHPAPMNARLPHDVWLAAYATLAPDLKTAGVEVVNCSPDSAITVFPKGNLIEVLCLQSATSGRTNTTDPKYSAQASRAPATRSPTMGRHRRNATS